MKRRIGSWILLAALVCVLACIPAFGADSELFFVSVSDTLPLSLPSAQMPYYADGTLYAPYTVFNAAGLGITPSYNTQDRILTLFTRSQRLVFDLDSGTATDETGKTYTDASHSVAIQGSVVFLPASTCARHFGWQATLLKSEDGYTVLRFKSGGEVYDDTLFLVRANNLMKYTLQQYRTPSPQTTTPTQTTQPEQRPQAKVFAYLAVEGAKTMTDSLSAVLRAGTPAVFYLTADEIRENPDLVIAIAAAGYPIGLTAPKDAADVSLALQDANNALRQLLCRKTLLALVTAQQSENAAGYFLQIREGARSYTAVRERTVDSYLVLCEGNTAAALAALTDAKVSFGQIRETTVLN